MAFLINSKIPQSASVNQEWRGTAGALCPRCVPAWSTTPRCRMGLTNSQLTRLTRWGRHVNLWDEIKLPQISDSEILLDQLLRVFSAKRAKRRYKRLKFKRPSFTPKVSPTKQLMQKGGVFERLLKIRISICLTQTSVLSRTWIFVKVSRNRVHCFNILCPCITLPDLVETEKRKLRHLFLCWLCDLHGSWNPQAVVFLCKENMEQGHLVLLRFSTRTVPFWLQQQLSEFAGWPNNSFSHIWCSSTIFVWNGFLFAEKGFVLKQKVILCNTMCDLAGNLVSVGCFSKNRTEMYNLWPNKMKSGWEMHSENLGSPETQNIQKWQKMEGTRSGVKSTVRMHQIGLTIAGAD